MYVLSLCKCAEVSKEKFKFLVFFFNEKLNEMATTLKTNKCKQLKELIVMCIAKRIVHGNKCKMEKYTY